MAHLLPASRGARPKPSKRPEGGEAWISLVTRRFAPHGHAGPAEIDGWSSTMVFPSRQGTKATNNDRSASSVALVSGDLGRWLFPGTAVQQAFPSSHALSYVRLTIDSSLPGPWDSGILRPPWALRQQS